MSSRQRTKGYPVTSLGTWAIFARSAQLFVRNLVIIVPGFLLGGLSTFVAIMLAPSTSGDNAGTSDFVARTISVLAQTIATVLAIAFTTGMADAAWRAGRCSLGSGFLAFRRDGGHVLVALLALLLLGLLAATLAPFTLSVSLVVYAYFFIYTMPSAVVGERPGIFAIGESAKIALARPLTTFAILAAIFVVVYALGFVALLLSQAPYVGSILESLVVQAVVAFATLVVVGEYRAARQLEISA